MDLGDFQAGVDESIDDDEVPVGPQVIEKGPQVGKAVRGDNLDPQVTEKH